MNPAVKTRRWWSYALPHVAALVLFAAVSAVFFYPQYDGKALRQGDMVRVNGVTRDIELHKELYGEHPQWAGRNFGGMPAYAIDMDYQGRVIKQAADRTYVLGMPAAYLFVAMAGFYLMLLLMGVNPWLAMVGGLGYGLSSYFVIIIAEGHLTKMLALAWAPPLIGALWYAYRRNRWLGAALAGLFGSIQISASHPQITYYFLWIAAALVVNEAVRAARGRLWASFGKTTAALLLAAGLAFGSNLIQLYYLNDYSKESTRSGSELTADRSEGPGASSGGGLDKEYATAWSYGKMETLNLLIPNLYGGANDFRQDGEVNQTLRNYQVPKDTYAQLYSYWGPQPYTKGPVYLGAALLFLALFALFLLPGRQTAWIAVVAGLAILLAWGKHFMWLSSLFLDYFPLYDKFRTVSTILVIVEWAVPLLAILGLQRLWSKEFDPRAAKRALFWSAGIAGGLCLLVWLLGPAFSSFEGVSDPEMGLPDDILGAMIGERAALMRADALRSLGYVALAAGLLWAWMAGKLKNAGFALGIGALVLIDLFTVDKRYASADDFRPKREALAIPKTEIDEQILQDTSNYRVANLATDLFQDANTSYYHRSVGGYHAAKLSRYQDLIKHHLSQGNAAVYDMLNAKYFIMSDRQQGGAVVQQNPNAAGNAWAVDSIRWVSGPDAEIAALGDGFDPHRTAVVDERFRAMVDPSVGPDSTASVTLTDYRVNRLTYHTSAARNTVAVFSEIYYPKGWSVTLDGVEAPYFRADYLLRAMVIPAGEHTLVFSFRAPHWDTLVAVTRLCSWLLIGGVLFLIGWTIYKPKRTPRTDE